MMDHSEQLLDIMDSSFLEHKDSALAHHSYHMDVGTINLTSSSPLLTGASGNASYVPYTFLDHGDAGSSPSSPLTDHSSSDHDIPLSPQNDHPFSEALGDNSLFLQIPTTATGVVPSATTVPITNVSSSSVPSSTRPVVAATPAPSSSTTDGKRKRKAAAPVASSASSSIKSGNTRATKGRRTDGKKEAATAATKSSSTTSVKKASATPTPTSKPSSIRTTRSGTRTTSSSSAPSPLVPNTRGGRDEDKTSANESSSSSIDIALPSLEAIPNDQSSLPTPPHLVAAMGNLAVMGAVTLAQPEYERMLAEEERTKEKKLRKAEQARISRQKKKDRMTLLEESVAMYKQQIAHLQSLPAAVAAPAAPVVPATPVPVTNAERKSSVSPVWNGSSNSSSDDARSVQSGDDSSSSSSGSSIAPSPSHAPVASVNKQEADVPAVTAPAVCVEDEVNGEAIQRCIQTIITSSYPAASPAGSPNGSTISGYGLMATGSVHAGVDSKEQSHSNAAADQLNANIQGLFDMFAKRQRVTESHLESLDKLLVPSMPLRFLEWSLTQNDKFYSDPNGLWHCLWSKTLSLTPEQMTALHALRNDVSAQRAAEAEIRMQALSMTGIVVSPTPTTTTSSVDGTMATATTTSAFPVASISPKSLSLSSTLSLQAAYSQLSALSRLHLQASNRWLRTLATILTPLQVARYFEWVNIYGHICVQINV